MAVLKLAFSPRFACLSLAVLASLILLLSLAVVPDQAGWAAPLLVLMLGLVGLGIRDLRQTHHAVLRNYPFAAHLRCRGS